MTTPQTLGRAFRLGFDYACRIASDTFEGHKGRKGKVGGSMPREKADGLKWKGNAGQEKEFEESNFPSNEIDLAKTKSFVNENISKVTPENARQLVRKCASTLRGWKEFKIDGKLQKVYFGSAFVKEAGKLVFGKDSVAIAKLTMKAMANIGMFQHNARRIGSAWRQIEQQDGTKHHPNSQFYSLICRIGGKECILDIAREYQSESGKKRGYLFNVEGTQSFKGKKRHLAKDSEMPNSCLYVKAIHFV